MSTIETELLICNQKGLHARAAAAFVKCIADIDAEVMVEKDGQEVDGSSILSLMMLAASKGSKIKVKDGFGNEAVFSLNRPNVGIYLPKMIWKDMYDFSEDSVLLCLASEYYDSSEYIKDFEVFSKIIKES